MANWNDKSWKTAALAAAVALSFGSVSYAQVPAPSSERGLPAAQHHAGGELDKLANDHADLSTFASALKVAGLEHSLTDGKDYTVFAPTNEALDDKPGKGIDKLLEPDNRDELISFVRAHIVAEAIDLQSPRQFAETRTIDGEKIDIERNEGVVKVDNAKVVNANGVAMGNLKFYAIDDVLARSGKPIADEQVQNRNSSALAPGRSPGIAGSPATPSTSTSGASR